LGGTNAKSNLNRDNGWHQFAHKVPLVRHYYEGDGKGGQPGYEMTPTERKAYASDRGTHQLQTRSASNSQGATMSRYSQLVKLLYGFTK